MLQKKSNGNETAKYIRIAVLLIYDILAVFLAEIISIWTRFEFSLKNEQCIPYLETAVRYFWINVCVTLVIFAIMHLYNSLWKYASVQELLNVVVACLLSAALQSLGMHMLQWNMPRSYYILYFFFLLALITGSRFVYRGLRIIRHNYLGISVGSVVPTMVIGAGDSAYFLIKNMENSPQIRNRVACVIDADQNKIGSKILGAQIVGNDSKIPWAAEKYGVREIFIAIPNLPGARKKKILELCKNTGCKIKILPSMAQIVNEEVAVSNFREVEIEDLLGREPVKTNLDEVMGYIAGKVVLVTGGGGSIGSELCRQIAAHHPAQLIIFDIYENTTYDLQQELKKNFPKLNLVVLIGSVRNTHRVDTVFADYKPAIVFHAAAHKHVPLMEDSPNEAIKNNVFGTYKTARAADKFGVKRFVLISTDKAVNPTNIMGASKRMCEMIIQTFNRYSKTEYVAVRFGNVLGSNGSVIPLFKRQMAAGGPLTVTHPDIIRYFMTIPEASQLVLQSGAIANNGELFVLDMGQPVKIMDLAENMIRLSGVQGIEIIETGLRPGEKLYEELLVKTEELDKTDNSMIFIERDTALNKEEIYKKIKVLRDACDTGDDLIAKEALRSVVPTFKTPEEVNKEIA